MNRGTKKLNLRQIISDYGIVVVLILMIIIFTLINPRFLQAKNLLAIITQSSIFGIIALGVTPIIIAKGIDLSLGSMLAFSGMVMASLAQRSDSLTKTFPNLPAFSPIIGILIGLFVAVLAGSISGSLVAKTGIPAFIATLGMQTILRGGSLLYTSGRPISDLSNTILFFGKDLGGIPAPFIVYLIMAIITWVLLNYTRFGSDAYAIGGNIHAAEVSGINVPKAQVKVFAYGGLMCGVAALVFAGRVGSIHPAAATDFELTAIAATTIGGTSQSGGIGTVGGAVIGALILGVLRNGLTMINVDGYWQQIVEGMIIIGAVVIDMRKNVGKR
ncbi:MAG: ABC transporter permease [Clostridiaceae bacterium]|nr:ABC transporter permease [Clostridiaceae bacterium]